MSYVPAYQILKYVRYVPEFDSKIPIIPPLDAETAIGAKLSAEDLSYLLATIKPIAGYFNATRTQSTEYADTADALSRILGAFGEVQEEMGTITSVTADLSTADTVQHYADNPDGPNVVVHLKLPISITGPDGKGPTPQPPTGPIQQPIGGSNHSTDTVTNECLTSRILLYHKPIFAINQVILPGINTFPFTEIGTALRGAFDSQIKALYPTKYYAGGLISATFSFRAVTLDKLNMGGADINIINVFPNLSGSDFATATFPHIMPEDYASFAIGDIAGTVYWFEWNYAQVTIGSDASPLGTSNIDLSYVLTTFGPLIQAIQYIVNGYDSLDCYIECVKFNNRGLFGNFDFVFPASAGTLNDTTSNAHYNPEYYGALTTLAGSQFLHYGSTGLLGLIAPNGPADAGLTTLTLSFDTDMAASNGSRDGSGTTQFQCTVTNEAGTITYMDSGVVNLPASVLGVVNVKHQTVIVSMVGGYANVPTEVFPLIIRMANTTGGDGWFIGNIVGTWS